MQYVICLPNVIMFTCIDLAASEFNFLLLFISSEAIMETLIGVQSVY